MIREYLLNFFYWWYGVKVRDLGSQAIGHIIFVLEYTNTLPMARFLFVPLFQDDSGVGKALSFVIRLIWVWFGSIVSLIMIIPICLYFSFLAVLPILALVLLAFSLLVVF